MYLPVKMVEDGKNRDKITTAFVSKNEDDENFQTQPDILTRRGALMQVTMAIVANITILSSGMGIGFPAIGLHSLTIKGDPMALTDEESSWFASVTAITCPIGALLAGYLLEKLGRKYCLISINVVSIISWIILAVASKTDKDLMVAQLIVSRVIIGIGIGMSSSPASVYSAEISHPSLRGRLTILTALSTAIGMLCVYTLGYFIPDDFRIVSIISGVCTVISCITLIPLPESPTWLVSRHRYKDAEDTLRIVRGVQEDEPTTDEIYNEIARLKENVMKVQSQPKLSVLGLIKKPEIYKPLAIMIIFFAFQQFSGIFVIMIYGAKFAKEAGVSIDPFLCTVLIGLTRVLTTFLTGFMSDRFGRRPSGMISSIGMTLCMFGLAFCTWYQTDNKLGAASATFLIAFIFFATLGLLTLPFAMIAEVFPQQYRGVCAGFTIFGAYSMSFIIVKLFPFMLLEMGNVALFIFYGIISLLGGVYILFVLPETKGKTLQEIESLFTSKK